MKKIEKAFEILKYAIENKTSLPKACENFEQKRNFVANLKLTLDTEVVSGNIAKKDVDKFNDLYSKWKNINDGGVTASEIAKINPESVFDKDNKGENYSDVDFEELWSKGMEEAAEDRIFHEDYDAEVDADYDERSTSEIIRDEEGKIEKYTYKVMIRGERDLVGEFSREEMDMVYRLYSSLDGAGLTQRNIVREFSHLDLRDFKRILRAFNITKQSIPVAPHIIEENTTLQVRDIVFRNKENNLLKKLDQDRNKEFEKLYYKVRAALEEEKQKNLQIKKIISDALIGFNAEPLKIEIKPVQNEVALMVYLSDMHVGAHNDETESLFSSAYDADEFAERLVKVLNKIGEFGKLYGRIDSVYICNLGDNLDGFNANTTRGGHELPQNLNNREQFTTYVNGMMRFFTSLYEMNISNNIHFMSVGDCNHSGDFGYTSNWALLKIMELRFPEVQLRLFDKFIEHFEYGNHCFIMTHGKDKKHKKHGFPLSLDTKTELYFNDYIIHSNVDRNKHISVVKADLHSNNCQAGKFFRYRNTMSLYGGSPWIDANFGYTKPGVSFDIVSKNDHQILESWVSVK